MRPACACIPIVGKLIDSNDLAVIICHYASIPEYTLIAKFLRNNKVVVNTDGVKLKLIGGQTIMRLGMQYEFRSQKRNNIWHY